MIEEYQTIEVYDISLPDGGIYESRGEDAESAVAADLETIEFVGKSLIVKGYSWKKGTNDLPRPFRCEVTKG